jgi:diguanylate cyclase (GGDEF)-like protein
MRAELPKNEAERLEALRSYDILDSGAEQAYDDLTRLAAYIADAPVAMISLVDEHRQWFKAKVGLDVPETPRDQAFCAHAILKPEETLVVPDATRDQRFADNPLVTDGPGIRFYMGTPLLTPDKQALGTLCVIDSQPRQMESARVAALEILSRQVVAQLELRRVALELKQEVANRDVYLEQLQGYQQDLEKTNLELQRASLTDGLTRIANRAAFDRRLEEEVYRAQRYKTGLSLAMLDVDKFKEYNDSFGHPAGDGVLQEVARLLRSRARPSDLVARYGGEEFAVILTATGRDSARSVAESLRATIEGGVFPNRAITVSVGVAALGGPIADPDTLLQAADKALYAAKRGGRNRVVQAEMLRG